MSSVFDFLFQGSPPPSVTSSTTSQQGFPDWYQELMRANIGQAIGVSSQPYQAYPGQQVANFTAPTQQAFQMTQGNVGSQDPSLNKASSALTQVAGGFDPSQFSNYMNPYVSGVANQIQRLGNQNLTENVLPQVNDAFTGAGQFGSTRNADFTNRAIRDNQLSTSTAQGQALMSGTQNAMQNYLQGQQNQNIAGQQLGTLGQIYQNTGLKDAASLDTIGQEQQGLNQSNLNTAYNNWQSQISYPYNQTNFLNNIIRGIPMQPAQSSVSINPAQSGTPSALSQAQGAYTNASLGGLGALAQSSVSATPII